MTPNTPTPKRVDPGMLRMTPIAAFVKWDADQRRRQAFQEMRARQRAIDPEPESA